jgi:hypothetical protein
MGELPRDIVVPELRDENNVPGVVYLRRIDPNTGDAEFQLSLPKLKGTWVIPLEVTYKPWINLVWVGVLVMGLGVLLAMIRRAFEARTVLDGPLAGSPRMSSDEDGPGTGKSGPGKTGPSSPARGGRPRKTGRS